MKFKKQIKVPGVAFFQRYFLDPSISTLDDLRDIAKPLYNAWRERYNLYGMIYFLGERRSYNETVILFEKIIKAVTNNDSVHKELNGVVEIVNKLLTPKKNILSFWKKLEPLDASYLREALTVAGIFMAFRLKKDLLDVDEGIKLYHFYVEVGLRKTALILSKTIMEKIDYSFLKDWENKVSNLKQRKYELKHILEDALRKHDIPYYIHSRIKSPYSTYEKIKRKNTSLDKIKDLLGMEILVEESMLESALKTVLGRLGKMNFSILEIENYSNYIFDLKLLSEIYGGSFRFVHSPRTDGYNSLHISLNGGIEIKITPKEKKLLEQEGAIRHTLYKKQITVDNVKEAIAKSLILWSKQIVLTLDLDLVSYRVILNEGKLLPVEILFKDRPFFEALQKFSPRFNGKKVILDMDQEHRNALFRGVGVHALQNKEYLNIVFKGNIVKETRSKVIIKVTDIIVE